MVVFGVLVQVMDDEVSLKPALELRVHDPVFEQPDTVVADFPVAF